MSDEDNSQERSFDPTPKRRKDARDKGQVPRSRDLNAAVLMLASAGMLLFSGSYILEQAITVLRNNFSVARADLFDKTALLVHLKAGFGDFFTGLVPMFVSLFLLALIAPASIGGLNFSAKALGFKGERISPLKGIKRMFSAQSFMELIKSILKFVLILSAGGLLIWFSFDEFIHIGNMSSKPAFTKSMQILGFIFLGLAATLIIIAAIDVPFQLWNNFRKLRMTHRELKEEMKQTNGSPEVKGRIRQVQQSMAQRRMMSEVPTASVIITNPTHYAIALRYDENGTGAPIVVAKGVDHIAAKIREIGEENKVAIVSAPPLARAIYFNARIGQEVPTGLYVSVAKVLSYVFQLKRHAAGFAAKPQQLTDLPIPDELKHDAGSDAELTNS